MTETGPASYLAFLLEHRRFLLFGFALAFFSSFGQTFFIGLFGDDIRGAFELTEGEFGAVYSVATLTSGLCVIPLGRLIDRVDLRVYSATVCAGLVAAAFSMAAAPVLLLLGAALFGLRLFGQGLASHTSGTAMARYFDRDRGKAMSLAGLGYPAGEAVLPLLAVQLAAAMGWRQTWLLVAVLLAAVTVPLTLLLLRGHGRRHVALLARTTRDPAPGGPPADSAAAVATPRQWTGAEALRDPRFYVILPVVMAPGFIVTGLFFHQTTLVQAKGWTAAWFAACFAGFAATQLPSGLLAGPVVDRLGATRLLPLYTVPLGLGLVALVLGAHPATAMLFMVMAGLTSGMAGPVVGAAWAELYGVRHLGAIRAMASALLVLATALSPVGMGLLIDRGVSMETITLGCVIYLAAAIALVLVARPRP